MDYMIEDRDQIISLLKEKAYRKGEFKLSSGTSSEHYVNCKPVTLSSEGLTTLSFMLLECIEEGTKAIAGLTLGADPLVSGVAMASWLSECPLDGLIVRKEPKGHGTQAWIEGPLPPPGSKVVVVEDVVTTGGSALKAVEKIRDAGYVVDRVVAIVDRQEEGAYEAFDKANVEFFSLFILEELYGEGIKSD